ncbi:MAG: thiamine-phosphate kinase [Gammaproteobacteria bacterium]|nr:thiamine-phosphate kinase [Gammaproteobacteria bacterium]MDH5799320.1 thiamine-phosphate kinase [Gammaproteobacteria bacterium]
MSSTLSSSSSLNEFQFIRNYLKQRNTRPDDVILDIGDDCAILKVPDTKQLAVTLDTMVAGVHFPEAASAAHIGHKCLAVSLSDLAAMGAEPAWVTLALTLPCLDETWLQDFCDGFFNLARQFKVQLVGGDVTRGPLCISTQCHGFVSPGKALRRDGAGAGDKIYVSGTIGEAALGLMLMQNRLSLPQELKQQSDLWLQRLNRPAPRVSLGMAIAEVASAAIDISDGLAADLQHILAQSGVGAVIHVERIPLPQCLPEVFERVGGWETIIGGGDDFELCFTVSPQHEVELLRVVQGLDCAIHCIGEIQQGDGLEIRENGQTIELQRAGYEHFTN